MRRASSHYALIILSAALLALLPVALIPDLLAPLENWHAYEVAKGSQRHQHSPREQPLALRSEMFFFKLLVIPPGYVRKLVLGDPTIYADAWIPSSVTDRSTVLALFPPFVFARENAIWAFPLWLSIEVLAYELAVRLTRRIAGHRLT